MTTANFHRVPVLGCLVVSLLVLGGKASFGQVYGVHQYTYHPEHGYVPLATGYALGGYGLGYGGMTPQMGTGIGAGAAASGMGNFAAGLGQLHEANAQAQIAHQQAQHQYLKNQGLAIQVAEERSQAKQERIERQKAEEKHRLDLYHKSLDQMAAAHRLTAEQFDMDRGILHWPHVLRGSEYAELRHKIDQLFHDRTPEDSGTDSTGYEPIQEACEQMLDIVKREVKKGMSATDYVTAKHFISSIKYEARFQVKPAK